MKRQDDIKTLLSALLALTKRLVTRILQLIASSLPNRCMLCQQLIDQTGYQGVLAQYHLPQMTLTGVCQTCMISSLYQQEVCLGCAKPMQVFQQYCGQCQVTEPTLVITPCSYHQGAAPLITAIKYHQQLAPLDALVVALAMRIKGLEQHGLLRLPQALVPVPLHPNRLRQRGYNQALLVAMSLSQMLSIPVLDKALIKVIDTPPQAGLDGKARRKHNQNAFTLTDNPSVQRVAIIDDVLTTGSTTDSIVQLYAQHGVHCQVWCLARAEAPNLR
ncbi:ComF family protein [Shewanella maritima]|uniref:ComF family protein n=1 Tax=Shewanella maritima TaxID=2520507 RepID=UPI003736B77E